MQAITAFAEKLKKFGFTQFRNASVPGSEDGASDPKVIALTLLARTMSNFDSALILIREKKIVEARTLTRSCFENLFFVAALRTQGVQLIKEMAKGEIAMKKMRGEFLLSESEPEESPWKLPLRNFLKDIKKLPTGNALSPKNLAAMGPLNKSYMFYSLLSADAAHPTFDALNRYITNYEENGVPMRLIDYSPVVKESDLASTTSLACNATIGVCIGVNEILEETALNSQLNALAEEYIKLSNDIPLAPKP